MYTYLTLKATYETLICGHISHHSVNFHPVISKGIHTVGNFVWGQKISSEISQWVQIGSDQQKPARIESDISVSCVSYITTLLTINSGLFSSEIPLMWMMFRFIKIDMTKETKHMQICRSNASTHTVEWSVFWTLLKSCAWPSLIITAAETWDFSFFPLKSNMNYLALCWSRWVSALSFPP